MCDRQNEVVHIFNQEQMGERVKSQTMELQGLHATAVTYLSVLM